MTLYSVFDRRRDEAPAVVPDRFSWFAALLPPVFGLSHRLWLETAIWVLAVILIVIAGFWLGADAAFWLYVAFALWIGWEAAAIRRRGLRRQGWVYRTELVAPAADLAQVEWMKRRSAAA
jgi:hypothetical protein